MIEPEVKKLISELKPNAKYVIFLEESTMSVENMNYMAEALAELYSGQVLLVPVASIEKVRVEELENIV